MAAQHRKETSNLANFKGNVCENWQLYSYIIFGVEMLSKYWKFLGRYSIVSFKFTPS